MSIGHLYVLFEKVPILCPFFKWIVWFFLVLSSTSSLQILNINPLLDISLVNVFSHLVGCLLVFLTVALAVQELFR